NDSPRRVVDGGHVRPFVTVTREASPGEIGLVRAAAMLGGNDVVGLVREPRILFVQQAILTTAFGPVTNQGAQRGRYSLPHERTTFSARTRALISCTSISACSN